MLHISEFLAGDNALGSLASLNAVNREIQTLTNPVLYETVILDQDNTGGQLTRLQQWTALNDGKRGYIK
jgi:hypothetical protein